MMQSCLYTGHVRHRRFIPVDHAFSYSLFMMYLDLAELPTIFAGRWLWSIERVALAQFRRSDHLGNPQMPLDQAVRDLVEQREGYRPHGAIRLLTHLRYFGYCFNPVSFYFCFDPHDQYVETIVAEITNTPWNEQYCYVLGEQSNIGNGTKKHYQFGKSFHVSPFMDMAVDYDWRFTEPGPQLTIHMENRSPNEKIFDATMRLRRQEISGMTLAWALTRYPFMTGKVIAAIYLQALRLKLKKAPFYTHPAKRADNEAQHV